MTAVKELSEKARDVMEAILTTPGQNASTVAQYLGVSVATVTGSLSTLKKKGYVTVEEGILIATDEAKFEFGDSTPTPKGSESTGTNTTAIDTTLVTGTDTTGSTEEGIGAAITSEVPTTKSAAKAKAEATPKAGPNKAEKARAVFESMTGQPRKDIMAALMAPEVGLSKNGANTYIYNMRKAAGLVTPRAPTSAEAAPAVDKEEAAAGSADATE